MRVKVLVTVDIELTDEQQPKPNRHRIAHSAVQAIDEAVRFVESNGFNHDLANRSSISVVGSSLHWVD